MSWRLYFLTVTDIFTEFVNRTSYWIDVNDRVFVDFTIDLTSLLFFFTD